MVGTESGPTAGRQIGIDGYVGALHQRGARDNRRGRGKDTSDGAPRARGQGDEPPDQDKTRLASDQGEE